MTGWWILVLVGCSLLATFFACALCKGGNPDRGEEVMSDLLNKLYQDQINDLYDEINHLKRQIANFNPALRDQFAMVALQGLLTNPEQLQTDISNQVCLAYEYADAMMKARKCPPADD